MKAHRWNLIRDVFERAIDLGPEDRSALLEEELQGDDDSRSIVEELIRAEEVDDDFLEPPEPDALPALHGSVAENMVGQRFQSYELTRLIGAGGMGVVYEAVQAEPRRAVALKMMRVGLTSERAKRRFSDEADLLARLKHPGIAQIYAAGVGLEGRTEIPWFAMELVEGARSINAFADQEQLNLQERLTLFRRVCEAVHHGHQRGVIHRDLKPANLLVDRSGNVKVIDFGVAKVTDTDLPDATELTLKGELFGTLLYMSPEQISGRHEDVDTRSDIYALGVVLYELVCGTKPFNISELSLAEAGRILTEEDPPPPSRHKPVLPPDLDWVIGKAMAKEHAQRYPSAFELAEEIGRFLNHEAVAAGPPSATYHLRKFLRRHRVGMTGAVILALAILAGLVGTTIGWVRTVRAEKQAQQDRGVAQSEARQSAAVVDFLVDVFSSPNPSQDGKDVRVVDVLDRARDSYKQRFADDPEVRARLAQALGAVYFGLGLDADSVVEYQEALTTVEADSEGPSEATARRLGELGEAHLRSGRFNEAETYMVQALEMEEQLGDHVGLYRAYSRMGDLKLSQKDKLEAERYARLAIEGLTRFLGPSARETLLTKNVLAGVLHEDGRLDEAEPLYTEALAGLSAELGDEHPDPMRIRSNLSALLFGRGKTEEAIVITKELVEIRRRTLGAEHPDTLTVISNLAGMLYLVGRGEEAMPLYEESLGVMEASLPDTHMALQAMRGNLAKLELGRGNYERAEELFGRVYETRSTTVGPHNEATLNTLFELTVTARKRGDFAGAISRGERGLESVPQTTRPLPFEHGFRQEVGLAELELGDFVAAEKNLLRCLETYAMLSDKGQFLHPAGYLVDLYERWERPQDAEHFRQLLNVE